MVANLGSPLFRSNAGHSEQRVVLFMYFLNNFSVDRCRLDRMLSHQKIHGSLFSLFHFKISEVRVRVGSFELISLSEGCAYFL